MQPQPARPQHPLPKGYSYGSLPLGSVLAVPVRIHILYLLVLVGVVVIAAWQGTGYNVAWALVIFGPVLLLSVLMHELGHCIASRQVGAEVHGILLWPLGGLAFLGQASTPAKDLYVAIAGPLTHIPQFAIWYGICLLSRHAVYGRWEPSLRVEDPTQHFWLSVTAAAAQVQLWMMAFNLLLPAYPLDGGRIFADLLLICRVPVLLTAKLTLTLAVLITVALFAYGCYRAQVLLILVSLWMLLSSIDLGRAIKNGAVHQHPMFCYEQQAPAPPPLPLNTMLPPNQPRSAPV